MKVDTYIVAIRIRFIDSLKFYTYLVYVDFEGGSTTFFLPAIGQLGEIETRSVEPRQGSVLVFPHGDSEYSLVHEGSAVTSGTKYVIRTDVLYANS